MEISAYGSRRVRNGIGSFTEAAVLGPWIARRALGPSSRRSTREGGIEFTEVERKASRPGREG